MTKIKQMLCALIAICLLFIGSTNAMAAQPDTPSISVSTPAALILSITGPQASLRRKLRLKPALIPFSPWNKLLQAKNCCPASQTMLTAFCGA